MKKLMITFMVALFATVVLGQTKAEIKPVQPAVGLGQTKTEIKPDQLPKCISDYLRKNAWILALAYKIDNKGVITYEVKVMKSNQGRGDLIFDNNCKLLMIDGKAPAGTPNANPAKPPAEEHHPLPPVKTGNTPQESTPKK